MADVSGKWREAYLAARKEPDPAKRKALCVKARRLIQDRLLELTSEEADGEERAILEHALRQIWSLERRR